MVATTKNTKTLGEQISSLEGFSFLTSGIYPFKLRDDFVLWTLVYHKNDDCQYNKEEANIFQK
mgnify:CR=1 FL=1